jgi:hypothetical protein
VFFGISLPQLSFDRAEQHDRAFQLGRHVVNRVALHQLRARDKLKILDRAVPPIPILETNHVARQDRPIGLFPDATMHVLPHVPVAETCHPIVCRELANLHPHEPFGIG